MLGVALVSHVSRDFCLPAFMWVPAGHGDQPGGGYSCLPAG